MRLSLSLLVVLSTGFSQSADFEVRSKEFLKARERVIQSGLDFLWSNQNADGSFGQTQTHLQSALAVLAQLSAGITPSDPQHGPGLVRAYRWLFSHSGEDGFMGDTDFPHESHAVGGLLAACLLGMGVDSADNRSIARQADRALQYSLKIQNQAVGAEYFGGWTPNPKVKVNDRMVTAWHLLFFRAMQYGGRKVPKRSLTRATAFVAASQKDPSEGAVQFDKDDMGGFSYDAAGLPVISVTSAGLGVLALYDLSESKRKLAVEWLKSHPPLWYGPIFYQTNFFGARGLLHHARLSGDLQAFDRHFRRIFHTLKEHQNPDGSFPIPPGNAENSKVMGKTYATPMALLILNVDREMLPIDMQP
ncbi:MAG: hypothetical protein HYU36_03755 [Planctomycetes bacterium]|nr:hypothetical protein [Planctomycetota bacterium]